MKVAFGTVVYQEAFAFVHDFINSINYQDYMEFDILLLNDNLQERQLNILTSRFNKNVKVWGNNDGHNPPQLRIELIKKAKLQNYDLLVLGDFDDVFSKDRISSVVEGYSCEYAFYYNSLHYMYSKESFFRNLPEEVCDMKIISEANFIGLSNSSLNLKLINQNLIDDLYKCKNKIFDWYLYTLILTFGLKGKMVRGKTYYRIHNQNIDGESKNNLENIMKEIEVKISHYDSLKDQHPLFNDKLFFYNELKEKILKSNLNILKYIDYENDYWWGKLNEEKIELY